MPKSTVILLATLLLISCSVLKNKPTQTQQPPNIIYILADDLGYGDLSCYGQDNFQTPNIDKLASRGIKLTQHYCGAAVCAPSRSALMTGQHTGHTPIRGNKELKQEGQIPLPAKELTIAEVLKTAGYKTGAFGKWGLGFINTEGDPNQQGFDEFYGYNCQRMAHRYYPPYLWHNDQKVMMQGNDWTNTVTYAPDEIQKETLAFIEKNKDEPFFAYMALVQPHAELLAPDDELLAPFKGKFPETPYQLPHKYISDYGPDIEPKKYTSQQTPKAMYAAMVTRIDRYVGEVVTKLEDLGIADNTLLIFVSDNGPAIEGGADPVYFNSNGGLRGFKRDLYEGGIRSPFIAVWPNKIKAGSQSNHVSAFWDMMPTFAEIAGAKIPNSTDGISILPTLLEQGEQAQHDYLYWEYQHKGGKKAVRYGDWKGVAYQVNKKGLDNLELYNLKTDEQETTNVAEKHPEILAKIKQIITAAREESELFPFH